MNFHVAILPSVTRFRSAFPGGGAYPCVQFGDGAIIPLPDWFLYPTAGFVRGQDCVAGVYQDRAALLWSSGAMEVYGVTLGPNSVFVDEAGIVSWVRSPDGAVILYSDDREPTPSRDTTHPRSRDANGRADWNGILVVPLGQSGPWEIGEEAKAPDGRTRILARLRGGAPQIAYDGYTPLPAHLQDFQGDVCVVAISLPKDEQTFFVESKDFKAYTPLEEPPLSMPKFTPIGRPVCIVIDGGPGHRWFADTVRWKNEKLGVLCTLGHDDVAASAALAREKGIPFCPYTDTGNPKDTARQFAAMPEVPTTPTLPIGQCYPIRGETNDDFAVRARRIFGVLSELPTKHFGVYACAFLGIGTDGLRTKQQVIDGLAIVGNLAREFHKCRLIVAFAWERGSNDGLAHQPELQAAFGWLQRASTAPDNYPTVEELRDAPQTPQRPTEPQKPTPVPTHAQLEQPPYAQFVNVESRQVFGSYVAKHGHDPAVSDLFHFFWRRLVEGWSHAQILGDIRGEQQSVEFQAKLPWQPEYALFMSWAHRVQAEYHARHGRMPAETDMAHAAWRLLVERYSFSALLAGIGGTAPAEVQGEPAQPAERPTVLKGQLMLDTRNPFAEWKHPNGEREYPAALPGKFFMAELDVLWVRDRQEAERIITDYVAQGFNHVPAGPIFARGYHGHFPNTDWRQDIGGFADYLEWLLSHGVEFTLMLLPDIEPYFHGTGRGWDMDLVRRDLTQLYTHPRIQALTKRTCLAWEQWASIAEMAKAFDWQRECFPNAERTWHNGPTHLCPGNSDESEEASWRSAAQHGVTGFLLQTSPLNDDMFRPDGKTDQGHTALDVLLYDLWDISRRFGLTSARGPKGEPAGNPWGRPVTQPDGSPLTLDYFEGMAFAMYWGDGDAATAAKWGEAASRIEGVRFCLDGAQK